MNPILRNALAVIAGVFLGSVVNMIVIVSSGSIIPPPNGVDVTTMEGLRASMHLFEPKHFILPFLAHALGTFSGAYLTVRLVKSNWFVFAFAIGCYFLIGGIVNVILLPSPIGFTILDLGIAYLPMSYIAFKLGRKRPIQD